MKKIDFNHDWIFTQEDTERQELLTLPHDAMINTDRNPGIRNYFLLAEFEAVYCMSRGYINGEPVCENRRAGDRNLRRTG